MNSAVLWTLVNVLAVLGVSGVGSDGVSVSVMEGDSVTLYTDVEANQQEKMRWYCNDDQIAVVNRDVREICTDEECNEGTERFRDRLQLDHQTGSLTIMNIRTTDSGDYILKVINSGSFSSKIFSVSVHDAPEDGMRTKSVNEGESVTLDPGVVKTLNGVMMWYFNDIPIAEITGDQSKICTDDQCNERFRDRLQLDHQTRSLNITDIRTTDSGEYKLQITSRNFSISRISAELMVIAVPDSGLSPRARSGIVVAVAVVLLFMAAVAAVFICHKHQARRKKQEGIRNKHYQNHLGDVSPDQNKTPITAMVNGCNGNDKGNVGRERSVILAARETGSANPVDTSNLDVLEKSRTAVHPAAVGLKKNCQIK